jgi:hypothetical protein
MPEDIHLVLGEPLAPPHCTSVAATFCRAALGWRMRASAARVGLVESASFTDSAVRGQPTFRAIDYN